MEMNSRAEDKENAYGCVLLKYEVKVKSKHLFAHGCQRPRSFTIVNGALVCYAIVNINSYFQSRNYPSITRSLTCRKRIFAIKTPDHPCQSLSVRGTPYEQVGTEVTALLLGQKANSRLATLTVTQDVTSASTQSHRPHRMGTLASA